MTGHATDLIDALGRISGVLTELDTATLPALYMLEVRNGAATQLRGIGQLHTPGGRDGDLTALVSWRDAISGTLQAQASVGMAGASRWRVELDTTLDGVPFSVWGVVTVAPDVGRALRGLTAGGASVEDVAAALVTAVGGDRR